MRVVLFCVLTDGEDVEKIEFKSIRNMFLQRPEDIKNCICNCITTQNKKLDAKIGGFERQIFEIKRAQNLLKLNKDAKHNTQSGGDDAPIDTDLDANTGREIVQARPS